MQCKRYAPEKKVAVEAVRRLYGIAESLEKPARTFQAENQGGMAFADMEELKKWLRAHRINP